MRSRLIRAGASLILLQLVTGSALTDANPDSCGATVAFKSDRIDLSGYELTFEENFDQLDVSAWGPKTRWIAHTPWYGDFGDARFADPTDGFPFTVADGILRIEARKDSDGQWQSGLLSSTDPDGNGFLQQFGYFEMRAKLPPGPGVWPAFWLIGDQDPKTRAEIDIVEYYGHAPDTYHSVVHVWPKDDTTQHRVCHLQHSVPAGSLTEAFHDYGVSVEADWTVFYLDRKEMGRVRTPPEHHGPMFILLNLALGSGWPIDQTINPSFMYVEHVHAYRRKVRPDEQARAVPHDVITGAHK
jgi:beta-glucanase (GH16 family)